MNVNREGQKYKEARDSLPEELRSIYEQLVDEYAFYTATYYGKGYVAYRVLASLIEGGWRPSETPKQQ